MLKRRLFDPNETLIAGLAPIRTKKRTGYVIDPEETYRSDGCTFTEEEEFQKSAEVECAVLVRENKLAKEQQKEPKLRDCLASRKTAMRRAKSTKRAR